MRWPVSIRRFIPAGKPVLSLSSYRFLYHEKDKNIAGPANFNCLRKKGFPDRGTFSRHKVMSSVSIFYDQKTTIANDLRIQFIQRRAKQRLFFHIINSSAHIKE